MFLRISLCVMLLGLSGCSKKNKTTDNKLTLYSARNSALLDPVLKKYTDLTGVKFEVRTDKGPSLLRQLLAQKKSNADLLISVDANTLMMAEKENVLSPLDYLPDDFKSPFSKAKFAWVPLSLRARALFYNEKSIEKIKVTDIEYADLAFGNFKGELCLRTSAKVYNQALVAALIEEQGEAKALEILKAWVQNLEQPVYSSDRDVIRAVAKGVCTVGIANTYYLGRLIKAKEEVSHVKVVFPKLLGGVHVNVSGIGLLKNSKNKEEAQKFVTWLLGDEGQQSYAVDAFEYPILKTLEPHEIVQEWGDFKVSEADLKLWPENWSKALSLIEKSGYK